MSAPTSLHDAGQPRDDTHVTTAGVVDPSASSGQGKRDTQLSSAAAGTPLDSAGHSRHDAHSMLADAVDPLHDTGLGPRDTQGGTAGVVDPLHFVLLAADTLDDLEGARMGMNSRLFFLTRSVDEGGKGVPESHPVAIQLEALKAGLAALEHEAELTLKRELRKHPLHPWIKATVGIGEKQAGRLLAATGDPYVRDDGTLRTLSQFRSYCGFGDAAAQRLVRGQKVTWSPVARSRTWLIAEACMKQRTSPYRAVYDAAREHYADAVHAAPCPRCGPKGKPAPEGSPLSDGHKHARGLRAVAKAVLRDLWREAKRLHELDTGQRLRDAHSKCAGVDPSASSGQGGCDTHDRPAAAGTPLHDTGQGTIDTHGRCAGVVDSSEVQ